MISNFPLQAVELDDLSPVDDLVKHSSSAVDIRTVLMQVVFLQIANCICTNWNTQALQLTFALSSCRLFELIIFQFKKKNILSFKLCNKHLHNAHAVFWERKTSPYSFSFIAPKNIYVPFLYLLDFIFPDKNLLGPTVLAWCGILLCIHLQNSWCKSFSSYFLNFNMDLFGFTLVLFQPHILFHLLLLLHLLFGSFIVSSLHKFFWWFFCSPLVGKTAKNCLKVLTDLSLISSYWHR